MCAREYVCVCVNDRYVGLLRGGEASAVNLNYMLRLWQAEGGERLLSGSQKYEINILKRKK